MNIRYVMQTSCAQHTTFHVDTVCHDVLVLDLHECADAKTRALKYIKDNIDVSDSCDSQ